MPNTVIQLKKSATPSSQPASLANGELALNFADGIIYYKAANGTIAAISGTGTGGGSSGYGTINANGTLLLAAIPNDKFTVLPGDFITITGDAVNDTFTIGANVKVVYDTANAAFGVANSVTTNTTAAFAFANGVATNTTSSFNRSNLTYNAVNSAFGVINSAFGVANNALANTSGVYFNGNLFFPSGNVGIGLTSTTDRLSVAGDVISFGDNYNSGTKALKFQRVENKAAIWSVPVGSFGRADIRFTTGDATVATPKTEADATVRIAPAGGVAIGNAYLAQNPTDGNLLVSGNIGVNTTNPQTRLHANGSISSYSSDGTNYGVLSSDRISIGQNNAFRTVIAHSGNESLHFIPYGSLTLALSSVDFTPSVQIPNGKTFGWSSTAAQSNSPDLVFHRDAANTFAQRNGTAGQTYRLYGTYTDASNYERLRIAANTTAHYIIGEEGGSGAARPLYLGTNNSTSLTIDASGNVGIGTVSPVAKLSVEGSLRFASDGAGGNWLQFSRSASNQWSLDTQGVGTVFSVVGNQITFPQNVIIQRDGLTITPTNTTDTALRVNHSTTTNNSINLNITPTWNGTGNNFTLIGANVTDTASSSLSSLINLKVGGTSNFVVSKDGNIYVAGSANISLPTLIVSGQNVLSTIYTGDAASNSYTNVVGSSANNYAGAMANSANATANSTYVKKSGDTITGDLVVQGNLTTSGVVTYANTQTLLIGDALITLNNDIPIAVAPSEDAGIEVKRGSSANVALLWNEGSDRWTFTNDGTNYRLIASNTDVESANNYAGAMANAANVYATTINDANLVVARAYTNTSTTAANTYATAVGTAGNTYAQTVGTSANNYASAMANSGNTWASATFGTITNTTAAFAAANQAGVIANAAFAAGNAEFTFSNTIYAAVNSVFAVVNAAYTSSNADYTLTNATFTVANAAFGAANNAGTATNTTAAFAKANAALANTSGVYFNGNLFFPSGNVGIGLTSTTYKLEVAGSFAAQTKSFVISHPSKEGMFLRHGSLEGPENGVYVRGKVQGKVIELPDYWIGLVDEDTITVQLTAIGHSQNPYVVEVSNNNVFIDTENHTEPYCYFTIYGERKDVEKLVVEY